MRWWLPAAGRADGYDAARQRLEEVKTFKGRLDRQPASHRGLHWAQAKVYGWLLCRQENLAALEVALVYLNVGDQQETVFTEHCAAAELRQHFERQCERFLAWAGRQLAHCRARDDALRSLAFPFGEFRGGQRALSEAVYRAALAGRCLLAQAPTGSGKTMGTLFPMLKAAPARQLDKLFFPAAKTSGRQLALDALARIGAGTPGLPLRVLELVAQGLARRHPGLPAWRQSRPMAEAERRQFLARFTENGQGIGFAVLGGAFSEGIDLPGRRLIGAFLTTLGLPQMNPVNEQIRQRMQTMFGAGYDYTYLFPGLQKVVQAAGRVIRSPADQGVVHLIDDRFQRDEVKALLPRWWTAVPARRPDGHRLRRRAAPDEGLPGMACA